MSFHNLEQLKLSDRTINIIASWLIYHGYKSPSLTKIKEFTSMVRCLLSWPTFINHISKNHLGFFDVCESITLFADIVRLMADLHLIHLGLTFWKYFGMTSGFSLALLHFNKIRGILHQWRQRKSGLWKGFLKAFWRIIFGLLLAYHSWIGSTPHYFWVLVSSSIDVCLAF